MFKKIITILILLAATVTHVHAERVRIPSRLSLKEIDRPLILQRGIWQAGFNLEVEDVFYYFDRSIHIGQMRPKTSNMGKLFPRRALTRRVEIPGFPFPYLRALITENDIGDDSGRVRRAVVLEGGISGIDIDLGYYPQSPETSMILQAAAAMKWLLTDNLWSEARAGAYSTASSGYATLYLNGTIGVQLTGQIAATTTLNAWTDSPIYYTRDSGGVSITRHGGSGTIKFPIHICRYLSLLPGITVDGGFYKSSWSPYPKYDRETYSIIQDPRPPTESKSSHINSKIFLGIVWQYSASGVLFKRSMK